MSPDGQRTTLTANTFGYLAAVTNPAGETYHMDYTTDGLLTAFTTPQGHVNRFAYAALGRLSRDTNAGGGGWTLARTANARGYTNHLTSAEGRTGGWDHRPAAGLRYVWHRPPRHQPRVPAVWLCGRSL